MRRATHWVKPNHQCRIPKRWISFDTEARRAKDGKVELQHWGMGAAVRWEYRDHEVRNQTESTFESPEELWQWVTDYCKPESRTVVFAHNLAYDVRVSNALTILPELGWSLDWSNLDRNVSSMTWRSDKGTLVFADSFTWLPMTIEKLGAMLNYRKLRMPLRGGSKADWEKYCMRDAEIVAMAVQQLVAWVDAEELGNWQPTGAGMSYSIWRHRFMNHKVLVHDNAAVLSDERKAMHTGRAEAWRHGTFKGETWYEVDMRQAYTHIAAESELPCKYKFTTGKISLRQYEQLSETYRVLCAVTVYTDVPVVPHHNGQRTIWPVGQFKTYLWDTEVNELLGSGGQVDIHYCHVYTREPVLADWAKWVIGLVESDSDGHLGVVGKYAKHTGRALIGRLSLRVPEWEYYGENPFGEVCISYDYNRQTGRTTRLMHVGNKTFMETERREGRDSLPQITGWIMAECRVRLHWAMDAAGFDNIAHVDTDSVLVNRKGLEGLKEAYQGSFSSMWQVKATYNRITVYGPRNLRVGRERKVSGIPLGAKEVEPGRFVGERWSGMARDLEMGRPTVVTVADAEWTVKANDPRRLDASGAEGRTKAIYLDAA